jgi:hypothetical protein
VLSAQVALGNDQGPKCQAQDEGISPKPTAVRVVEPEALVKEGRSSSVQPAGMVRVILPADCDQSVRKTLSRRILFCRVGSVSGPPPLGVKQRLVKLVTTWSHIGSNFTKVFRHIAVAASSYGFPFSSLGTWEVTLLKTNSRSTFEKAVEAVAAKPLNKTSEGPRSEAG